MTSLEQAGAARADRSGAIGWAGTTPTSLGGPSWARRLAGSGEMGARICSFNWSSTSLGQIDCWPSSLREAVNICLRSRFQLAIYWGPHLVILYNDAERDVLGAMHPRALGQPAAEILTHMWDVVGPMLHGVARFDSFSLMELGVLLLVLTPIMRVLTSMVLFAVDEHDALYTGLTFLVLVMTVTSLLLIR